MAEDPGGTGGTVVDVTSRAFDLDFLPNLVDELHRLVYSADLSDLDLDRELRNLEPKYQDAVYAELIFLLSHLRFEPEEAKAHWKKIRAHREAMQAGLGKPVDLLVAMVSYFVEVCRQLRHPKLIELKLFEQTEASAYHDALTGLCNYRYFNEHLTREIERAQRYGTPMSLVMIDIDNFKIYNDANGHDAGNEALALMAWLLCGSLRKVDVLARYGGEEFALILPSTPKTDAHLVAERGREKIENYAFPFEETLPGRTLTASMGVATFPGDAGDAGELLRNADGAMYEAKARGKNRVFLHGDNRRSYRRIRAELHGKFCLVGTQPQSLTTLDVSERGFGFLAERQLPAGSLMEVQLLLPESNGEITASGRVVRVEEKPGGKCEGAIRILDIGREDQLRLAEYLRGLQADQTDDAGSGTAGGS